MLRPSAPDLKVYLHRAPIDLRRGRNGLAAMAREVMQKDLCSAIIRYRTHLACHGLIRGHYGMME